MTEEELQKIANIAPDSPELAQQLLVGLGLPKIYASVITVLFDAWYPKVILKDKRLYLCAADREKCSRDVAKRPYRVVIHLDKHIERDENATLELYYDIEGKSYSALFFVYHERFNDFTPEWFWLINKEDNI